MSDSANFGVGKIGGSADEGSRSGERSGLALYFCAALAVSCLACGSDPKLEAPALGRVPLMLVVFDALDASHVSHLGYERETTPNLDALAAQGVSFTKAFAAAPYTLASIPSLMTGRLPDTHGVTEKSRILPAEEITLAERLSAAGYRTYAAVSNPNGSSYFGMAQGFDSFLEVFRAEGDRERITASGDAIPGGNKPRAMLKEGKGFGIPRADVFVEAMHAWTAKRAQDETPFYYLHIMEPHWPYNPPEPFRSRFLPPGTDDLEALNERVHFQKEVAGRQDLNRDERAAVTAMYDGNLAYADWALGQIIKQLESAGVLDEFLILVTSDHGEAFWQHGVQGHNLHLFDEMMHVPLVVRFPKGRGPVNVQIAGLTSLLDVVPSLCSWLGLGFGSVPFDGLALDEHLLGREQPNRELLMRANDRNPTIGIRSQNRKSIAAREPKTGKWRGARYFDLAKDPLEKNPLRSDQVPWAEEHNQKLRKWYGHIQELNRSERSKRSDELAPEAIELLNDLGYTE